MSEYDYTFADEDGEFLLHDGNCGNPDCDNCGTNDAVVKVDDEVSISYWCKPCAQDEGIPATQDEADTRLTDVTFEVTITLGAQDSLPTESGLESAILTACERDPNIATVDGVRTVRL